MKDMDKDKNNENIDLLIQRYKIMNSINREEAKAKILLKIRKRKQQRWIIQFASVAAIILLFVSVTFYFTGRNYTEPQAYVQSSDGNQFESEGVSYSFNDSVIVASDIEAIAEDKFEKTTTWKTIRCGLAKKLQVVLPDSSIVHLGSGSEIRYNNDYAAKERRVELTGLGYFIVKSSVEHPFVVAYGHNEVIATGTQFNVNSYDLKNWKVALVKGTVDVMHNEVKHRLNQGRMAYVKEDNTIGEEEFDINSEIAWTRNMFVFNAQEMKSVIDQLSQWYGIDFEFSNELAKRVKIQGCFTRDIPLSKALEYLGYCADVRFVEHEDKIYIQ